MTREEATTYIKEWLKDEYLDSKDRAALTAIIEESERKEELLDKIRTEIAFKSRIVLKNTPNDDWIIKWNECIKEVLEVIDKYKAESEDKE